MIAKYAKKSPNRQKPHVFITDSQSWQISGSSGGSSSGFGGHTSGGARPQTAEIIKTFGERCPQVTINNKQDRADYVVLLDHEGGKSLALKDNKVRGIQQRWRLDRQSLHPFAGECGEGCL